MQVSIKMTHGQLSLLHSLTKLNGKLHRKKESNLMALDPTASASQAPQAAGSIAPPATPAQVASVEQALAGSAIPPREPPSLLMKIVLPITIPFRVVACVVMFPFLVAVSPFYLLGWGFAVGSHFGSFKAGFVGAFIEGAPDLFSPITSQITGIKANAQGYSTDEYEEIIAAEEKALQALLNPPPPPAQSAPVSAPGASAALPAAAVSTADLDDKTKVLDLIDKTPASSPRVFQDIIKHWESKADDEVQKALKKKLQDLSAAERIQILKDLTDALQNRYG
jgi:hypothetical protein